METTQHATEKKKRVTNKSKSKSENISKQMKWEAKFSNLCDTEKISKQPNLSPKRIRKRTKSKVSRRKEIMISHTCGIWKIIGMNLLMYTKQKPTHRHWKQTYGYQRGKEG